MPISKSWSAGPAADSTPTRSGSTAAGCRATTSTTSRPSARSRRCRIRGSITPISSKSFFDNALSIKVGQQAADVEFFDSQTDDLFINGTFGWPAIKASNLPAGGPAPPIAVPGIRVKAELSDKVTAFGAVFNGNPARPGRRRPAAARQSRPGVSRQRSAMGDRAGALRLRSRYRRPSAGRQFHARAAGSITGEFDNQRFTAEGCRSPIPAAAAFPQNCAAISASSPSSSRCSTGRRR